MFELFQYDAEASNESCETLRLLLERDGFPIEETPTNTKHVAFLRALETPQVKGITLNTNLYTNKEVRTGDSSEDEMLPKQADSKSDVSISNESEEEDDSYIYGRSRAATTMATAKSRTYQDMKRNQY